MIQWNVFDYSSLINSYETLCRLHMFFINVNNIFCAELTLNPPEGIVAGPINEENFFEWEALIT